MSRRATIAAAIVLACVGRASASTIPPSDLAAFLARCAPSVHPMTETALVLTESSANPRAMFDNASDSVPASVADVPHSCVPAGCAYYARTDDEARYTAHILAARSATLPPCTRGAVSCDAGVDLGIAQVNSRNLPALGLSIDDALDICTNLGASSAILTRAYASQGDVGRALQVYNSGRPDGAPEYLRRVRANARTIYTRAVLARALTPAIDADVRNAHASATRSSALAALPHDDVTRPDQPPTIPVRRRHAAPTSRSMSAIDVAHGDVFTSAPSQRNAAIVAF